MHPKDADGMANSVGIAPEEHSESKLFAETRLKNYIPYGKKLDSERLPPQSSHNV